MKIILPAGIGDVSWAHSKLYGVRDEISAVRVVDGAPRRTAPYLEACGYADVGYDREITGGQYQTICAVEAAQGISWSPRPTWEKIRSLNLPTLLIEANQHLEAGLPLCDWLPDLETYYHYPLHVSEDDAIRARDILVEAINGGKRSAGHPMKEGPVVGISCASYRGAEAWKTWGREEWIPFIKQVMDLGWRPILIGGGWDDLTYTVACELELPDIVGKTSVAQMIAVMNLLDSYIGFSSGMNVIRTVLDRPAMALWPEFQHELSRSWAPPHMLETHRYVAHLWRPLLDVWPVAKAFLRQCEEETARSERESNGPSLSRILNGSYNGNGDGRVEIR